MRSLSSALSSAYGAAVQKPAWLVQIDLSSTVRLCSYADVTWNGLPWSKADVNVSGLRVGAMRVSGSLVLGNADGAWGATALSEGFSDKRVRIWGYDANIASPSTSDPVLVCDALGGAARIGMDYVQVELRDPASYLFTPRAVVSPSYGFNTFIPAGRTITINGVSYVIQRGR